MHQVVAAVIPAHNEEKTVGNLVLELKKTNTLKEVVVVDDGSKDHTALVAKRAGAKVVSLSENLGKGGAMSAGVAATTAPLILFFDADMSGVTVEHLHLLLEPLFNNEADMVVGIRPILKGLYDFNEDLPILSGQRALRREVFESISVEMRQGYGIEEVLNFHCKQNNKRVKLVALEGLKHRRKIEKTNLAVGVWGYLRMAWQVTFGYIKVRVVEWLK